MFAEWCNSQIGFGLNGYDLDKGLLATGNKVYSEDTCVFVPSSLNKFLITRDAARGKCPIGVYWMAGSGKYRAHTSINGKSTHIGSYNTASEAHAAYCTAKEAEAYRWYERLRDGEFIVDPRVIERMRTWRVNE